MERLDPVQHFICTLCGEGWTRSTVRGRTPRFCPACRERAKQKRLTSCAWCGKTTLIRVDATACSRQCAMNLRASPSVALQWQQCTACLCWRSRGCRYKHETCSEVCEGIASAVLGPAATALPPVDCVACGTEFIPRRITGRYCTPSCNRKAQRRRRRAREYGSFTEWRWSDFMRMAARFDYCCAYCGTKPERLDPDHVVPLSRGGANAVSNLLPCCAGCNSDKNAHSLPEWADSRVSRQLLPRTTQWSPTDPRYWHLTSALSNKTEGQAA